MQNDIKSPMLVKMQKGKKKSKSINQIIYISSENTEIVPFMSLKKKKKACQVDSILHNM